MATWPSGKAEACKAFIPQFESGCRLLKKSIQNIIKLDEPISSSF